MREKSFERNFYITDHLGTVRVEMDVMGNVISTHDFEPFGVELPPSYAPQSKLLYTGQERDSYTNYDYFHFRYYASSIGRFLKPDNIIPDITNPQNWNAYSYVKGNPINYNDPSGHDNPDPIEQSVKVNTSTGNAPTSDASAPPPNDSQNLQMKKKETDNQPQGAGDQNKKGNFIMETLIFWAGGVSDVLENIQTATPKQEKAWGEWVGTSTKAGSAVGKMLTGLGTILDLLNIKENLGTPRSIGEDLTSEELKEIGTSATTSLGVISAGAVTAPVEPTKVLSCGSMIIGAASFGTDIGVLINAYIDDIAREYGQAVIENQKYGVEYGKNNP